jgi:predicted nucleotidyltransferase
MFPNHSITLVLSPSFTERGEISIINKWDKTKIALESGVDLVLELPFPFATQSADLFAKGAVQILEYIGCEYVVFGSESNDIELLNNLADIQLNNSEYDKLVATYLQEGVNYPTALSKALKTISKTNITEPNDSLGLSYVREIKKANFAIKPLTIQRTNDYHGLQINSNIVSASAIRNLIKENKDINNFVPSYVPQYINYNNYEQKLFELLKYKIASDNNLNIYQTVDEGIENRIISNLQNSTTLEELIKNIKTKRYTYNKISRMLIHILCSFTKVQANKMKNIEYIRVLGFDKKGQSYLKQNKKNSIVPIITNCKSTDNEMLNL